MTFLTPTPDIFATARPAVPTAGPTKGTAIVVPCYNEASRLDGAAFLQTLQAQPQLTFIFVNDGSTDDTLDRLLSLQACCPTRIEVINLPRNAGKAEAVRTGLSHACQNGAAVVGYWDADLATPLEAIADFDAVLTRYGAINVVYGARRQLLGHRINRTLSRRLVSRICAGLARLAVGLPIGDTQCGAKLLRNTSELQQAIATPFTAGWLFDVELFTRIAATTRQAERRFYEMPLAEWTDVAGSKVSGTAILRSGLQMLRLIARRTRAARAPAPRIPTGPVAG